MNISSRFMHNTEYIKICVIDCNTCIETLGMTAKEAREIVPELQAIIDAIKEMQG
jgi:hypothetical protein